MLLARRLLLGLLFVFCLLPAVSVRAAEDEDGDYDPPPLPTDKALWFNSSPFTWQQLQGKGVSLYFFTCDQEGLEELPKYIASAKLHALDPVIFIGVAMGATRQQAEQALKNTNYNFPTLCDPGFAFCKQCDTAVKAEAEDGVLGTVCSAMYVTAKGKFWPGWWDEPETTVADALPGAAWTTKPQDVPEPLWPLWRAVEFRKYPEALPLFKKSLNAGPEEQREAAKKLQDLVLAEIERQAGEIRAADESDQKWAAFSQVTRLLDDFRGYEVPKELDVLQKKLARSSQVKAGLLAEKQMALAASSLASPAPAIRKKAQLQLEKIVADFPETDLAERAQKLLATQQAAPK